MKADNLEKDTMKQGTVSCVGIGPGDPELLTLKAIKILNESDVVIVPQSEKTGTSIAYDVVLYFVPKGKTVLFPFTMSKNLSARQERYKELVSEIKRYVIEGKKVSYVTIGDPTIYSTAIYLNNLLKNQAIDVEIIPGVSSFNAASSALGISLSQKGENFAVYELPETSEDIAALIGEHSSVVFMKINKKLPALVNAVQAVSPVHAYLIKRAGLEGSAKYDLMSESFEQKSAPLSVAIVKKRQREFTN